MKTEKYLYKVDKHICYICTANKEIFLGSVTIDKSGAWTPHYQEDVKYLPINSALNLLGYEPAKNSTIE